MDSLTEWAVLLIAGAVAIWLIWPSGISKGAEAVGEGAGEILSATGGVIDDFFRVTGNALKKLCFWC